MKNPLYPLLSLVLGLFLLPTTSLLAQQTAETTGPASEAQDGEEEDEIKWMLDGLLLTAATIGMDEDDLFSALAHGLSMAEVARAFGRNPVDILDIALSLEESDILADLLDEEIDLDDAENWRDQAAADSAWLIYSADPFDLEEIVWVLDGTADACALSMMELAEWMADGVSIADIAKEMEVDLKQVSDNSFAYLEDTLDVLLLLEEIDEQEAGERLVASEEVLDDLLSDAHLIPTLDAEEL